MKLIRQDARWVFQCQFHQKDVAKAAGFRWDPRSKSWWSDVELFAARLARYADSPERERLDAIAHAAAVSRVASSQLSQAVSVNADVPAPDGLSYLPFQKAGIVYASQRPNTLIGDEMGLGKTVQALGLVNLDPKCERVLVVCPASLKINWSREATKWLVRERPVVVLDSKSRSIPSGPVLAIVNYDIVEKLRPIIDADNWDLLVLDECHYLKNPKAKRTASVFGRGASRNGPKIAEIAASRRVALTGTPILNRPNELWTLVRSFDPHGLGRNWRRYVDRYCAAFDTQYGVDASGASNLEELQGKLRASILVRRLKQDVLTELPPKRRQVIELPSNGSAALVKRERDAYDRNQTLLSELRAAVEVAEISDDPDAYRDAIEALKAGQSAAFGELSKLRHEVGISTVPYAIEHVQDAVESNGCVVVFAHHKDVVAQLASALRGRGLSVVTLTGDDTTLLRQSSVDAFQAGQAQVIILTIAAGGVGLTLTRSQVVQFVESDWVPGNLAQAEDRCHRIGQKGSVLVQHLVLEGSLAAHMAQVVIAKQAVIEQALDGGGAATAQDAPGEAIPEIPDLVVEAPKKGSKEQREREAVALLSEAERALIHRALRSIADRCDGAFALDGMGFNATDTQFGKRLAYQDQLVGRQVIYARRLALKYGRQLGPELREAVLAVKIQLPPEAELTGQV